LANCDHSFLLCDLRCHSFARKCTQACIQSRRQLDSWVILRIAVSCKSPGSRGCISNWICVSSACTCCECVLGLRSGEVNPNAESEVIFASTHMLSARVRLRTYSASEAAASTSVLTMQPVAPPSRWDELLEANDGPAMSR